MNDLPVILYNLVVREQIYIMINQETRTWNINFKKNNYYFCGVFFSCRPC